MVEEERGFSLMEVVARRGAWQATVAAAIRVYGRTPPSRPESVRVPAGMLIWCGPERFLALTTVASGNARPDLRQAFAGAASMIDQSDGRCLLHVSGPRVRDALAKLVSIDLEPVVFPEGAVAATMIDHVPVLLWRKPDDPVGFSAFALLIPASFARSHCDTILSAIRSGGGGAAGVDFGQSSTARPEGAPRMAPTRSSTSAR